LRRAAVCDRLAEGLGRARIWLERVQPRRRERAQQQLRVLAVIGTDFEDELRRRPDQPLQERSVDRFR
jgi:hypothetical protein